MQPDRRSRSYKAGVPRAKMFLKADLGWLRGYPIAQSNGAVEWKNSPRIGAPDSFVTRIDSELIRKAQYATIKLSSRFPVAMPKIVGDVDAWKRRCLMLLEILKSALEDHVGISSETDIPTHLLTNRCNRIQREIVATWPKLTPVIKSICWSTITEPDVGCNLLQWVFDNGGWCSQHIECTSQDLATSSIPLIASLWCEDGAAIGDTLGKMLSDSRCFSTATQQLPNVVQEFSSYFERWKRPDEPPISPLWPPQQIRPANITNEHGSMRIGSKTLPTVGTTTLNAMHWLANQKQNNRRCFISLWKMLISLDPLDAWADTWQSLGQILEDGHSRVKAVQSDRRQHRAVTMELHFTLKTMALKFRGSSIEVIRPEDTFNGIKKLIHSGHPRLTNKVITLISVVQGTHRAPLRNALMDEIVDGLKHTPGAVVRDYVNRVTAFLRRPEMKGRQHIPWKDENNNWLNGQRCHSTWTPLESLSDKPEDRRHWPAYFEALAVLCQSADCDSIPHNELVVLSRVTCDCRLAVEFIHELQQHNMIGDHCVSHLEPAAKLAQDPGDFRTFVKAFDLDNVSQSEGSFLITLEDHIQKSGWEGMVRTFLRNGYFEQLRILSILRIAAGWDATNIAIPQRPANAPISQWARRFPPRLQPQCDLIASAFPEGTARIEKLLSKYFPSPDSMKQEALALEEQLMMPGATKKRSHLATRLKNLRLRLHSPATVSEARLINLQKKLDAAAVDLLYRNVARQLQDRIQERLTEDGTKSCHFEVSISHRKNAELLAGLTGLAEPYRTAGLRIFRNSLHQSSWQPELLEANQRFLRMLHSRGINTAPWLQWQPNLMIEHDGDTITFSFARDNHDVLLMGYHFGTCLSPDGFNFFSAVTNAVDVNKIVLYAFDSAGNVAGRCLLAIGDGGCLVSFRPYSDRTKFPFETHVARLCDELAAKMNTVVQHSDHVSAIAMPDWYDDGAVDFGNSVSGQISVLEDIVAKSTPESLVTNVQAHFSPTGITAVTVPILLSTDALKRNPHLLRPFMPIIQELGPLDDETTLRLSAMLHFGGDRELCRSLLKRTVSQIFRRIYNRRGEHIFHILGSELHVVAEQFPSQLLRALRRTRWPDIKSDMEEYSSERRQLLAVIHDQLGRKQLGDQLRSKQKRSGSATY